MDVYCYEEDNPRLVSIVNDSLHVFTLAAPLIPIVISCVVSVYHVRHTLYASSQTDLARCVLKRRATVTVILLTIIYLTFNIPLVANLVVWIVTVNHWGGWPGPVYSFNTFTYMYLWNVTDVLFVGLNAASNPIIYFMRFPNCQRWVKSKIRALYFRLSGRKDPDLHETDLRLSRPGNTWANPHHRMGQLTTRRGSDSVSYRRPSGDCYRSNTHSDGYKERGCESERGCASETPVRRNLSLGGEDKRNINIDETWRIPEKLKLSALGGERLKLPEKGAMLAVPVEHKRAMLAVPVVLKRAPRNSDCMSVSDCDSEVFDNVNSVTSPNGTFSENGTRSVQS